MLYPHLGPLAQRYAHDKLQNERAGVSPFNPENLFGMHDLIFGK